MTNPESNHTNRSRTLPLRGIGTVIAALAIGAASLSSPAGEPETGTPQKRVVVPFFSEDATPDGQLDEAVWKRAAVIPLRLQNKDLQPATEAGEVRLWYSDEALHAAFVCEDQDIQATLTKRDSQLWDEEVVEFFVSPKELSQYFELQWNPLGTVFDARITNQLDADGWSKKFDGDWNWTAEGMTSGVKVEGDPAPNEEKAEAAKKDKKWVAEVRLPFSALGQPKPKAGETWRGNLFRYNRTGTELELVSWSPTQRPSFHEPRQFGMIEFGR